MDFHGKTISNLIKKNFPEHFRTEGPLLVAFVEEYFRWLEEQTYTRDEYITPRFAFVDVEAESANLVGTGSEFTTYFSNGDQIAIAKNIEIDEYDFFYIDTVANNTLIILRDDRLPTFTKTKTNFAQVIQKPNPYYTTRNFFDIKDIDETYDEYVIYFKEKYLKNIRFNTITDTRRLIKHSLDLYRSKGTERSLDLLYKIVFGKPARVYYPSQDIFTLSSGKWYIPKYLEITPGKETTHNLIQKQITGTLSGATAFIEEIIKYQTNGVISEVAYISAINGEFRTGEKIVPSFETMETSKCPKIIGSLNEIKLSVLGSGSGFSQNEIVYISSNVGFGAIGKVLNISNTTGAVNFEFVEGGYGYSNNEQLSVNTTGNVSVNSDSTVLGTGTLFQSEYSVGDYIAVWANTDAGAYEAFEITAIADNTTITVNGTFSFTNTDTKAAYTRYFAQTFISEKILKISNATFDHWYDNFEYVEFLDTIYQPMAYLNYESATGDFAVGDMLYTYYANNDPKGEGRVLSVTEKTTTSGILTISILSGDMDDDIYTTANAVSATLSVSNGYFDVTATGKFIGHDCCNVAISTNNYTGAFTVGTTLHQFETEAFGIVNSISFNTGNTIQTVYFSDTQGVFKDGFLVFADDGNDAMVVDTTFEIGVVDVSNSFMTLSNNYVYSSNMTGMVSEVSLGTGVNVTFSNTIEYDEEIEINTDYLYDYLTVELGATAYGLPANTSANLSASIGDSLTTANLTIGKSMFILSQTPGVDYNRNPIIKLFEPTTFKHDIYDTYLLEIVETSGYETGEIVTQADNNARGKIIEIANTSHLFVQRMRWYDANNFTITSDANTTLYGLDSGYEANVLSVAGMTQSFRFGNDMEADVNLTTDEGAITNIQILDSGFGFISNGEIVTIESEDGTKTAEGYAVLKTHGTGSGFYKSRDGFLSSEKKLSDGEYYQQFSYEVRSAVIDTFKDTLKDVLHVAGTKYFGALYYDTINNLNPEISTTVTIE